MSRELRVGFVGAGAMGGAIARGLLECGALAASQLAVCDLDAGVRKGFGEQGAKTYDDASDMLVGHSPDVVFLAVKPQVLEAVVRPISSALSGRLLVSIAAGVPLARLEELVPGARVVRTMPNLPLQVSSGAVAITGGTRASDEDVAYVLGLLSNIGVARVMREDQLDAAGVVCGCAPAFFALFVDALTRAGIEAGMVAADCREMVEATMRGTAEQLLVDGCHPRAYMERVSSPGGTTIAALRALEGGLSESVWSGVDAALARTRALSGK